MGDSITESACGPTYAPWSAMLSQRFQRKADVLNRGASGYTTRGYKRIFNEAIQELDAKSIGAVIIFLGTNDADPGWRHVDLKEYESNLIDLVKSLQEFGVSKERVVLLPPPPSYSPAHDPQVTEKYAQSAIQVAKRLGVATVDIHTIFRQDVRGSKLFHDGIHFNFDGAQLFFNSILPTLEDKLKGYEGRDQLIHHFGPPS